MKTTFRFGLPRQIAWLLLLLCYLAVSDGRAANPMVVPQEGSTPETILSQARLSLAEARKTQSDPRTAVGHYLDAADAAVQSKGLSAKKLGQFTTPRLRKLRSCCALPPNCGIGPK